MFPSTWVELFYTYFVMTSYMKRAINTDSDKTFVMFTSWYATQFLPSYCYCVCFMLKTELLQKHVFNVPSISAYVVLNLKLEDHLTVMYLKPGTVCSQHNVECGLVASGRRGGCGVQLKQTGGHLHFCCRGLLSSNHESYSQEKSQKICSEIYYWRYVQNVHVLHSESL